MKMSTDLNIPHLRFLKTICIHIGEYFWEKCIKTSVAEDLHMHKTFSMENFCEDNCSSFKGIRW